MFDGNSTTHTGWDVVCLNGSSCVRSSERTPAYILPPTELNKYSNEQTSTHHRTHRPLRDTVDG